MGIIVKEKIKDSGEWWVFMNHKGIRRSKKCGPKHLAEKVAGIMTANLTLGRPLMGKEEEPPAPTLNRYCKTFEQFYRPTLRPSSWRIYDVNLRVHALPRLGHLRLDEITRPVMKSFVAHLVEKGLARNSIRMIIANLAVIYGQAMESKIVSADPTKKLGIFHRQAPNKHEVITPLTKKESILFLKTNLEYFPRTYPFFLTALHTGARSGELAGLQWLDVDWHSKFIEVRRQINRYGEVVDLKTTSGRRRVDLSDDLLETLSNLRRRKQEEAMKKGRNEISEWIFINSRGNFLHSSTRTKQFKKVLRRAGLRDIRFHDLRHTFASQLLCAGANLLYVSQQLGHSNPQVTLKVYSHWIPNDNQREVMNKLPSINERVRFQREDSVAK